MIKGKIKQELTLDTVLKKISEYDIYRYYLGVDFKLNRPFKSPFHKDDHPSFLVGNKYGFLYHIDFAYSQYRGTCTDFVMQRYGLSFGDALKQINRDFGLGLNGSVITTRVVPVFIQPKLDTGEKRQTLVQVKTRRFDSADLAYWKQYFQTEKDLKDDDVYAVKDLWINKKRIMFPGTELVFGYLYNDQYWKIYRPHAKDKKDKWKNNCPIDLVDGLSNIKSCKKAIVTKSKKDKLVIKKIFPYICSVQNESVVALNSETIKHLKQEAKEVYINYDADNPGKENSLQVTDEFGFKHLNVPDEYFIREGIKDFAELARVHGLNKVKEYFITKGLI